MISLVSFSQRTRCCPGFLTRSRFISNLPSSTGPRQSPLPPDETLALRDWMESFKRERLSKSRPGCEVRFDRSGGKGGQNVNKVNTKATLKVNIDQASWIPSSLLSCLRDSPYYAASSNSLLITGSSYRTQSENLQDCFDKIQTHLLSLARPLSPKPTTTAQSQTVQKLIVAQKKRVRVEKDRRSEKKNERRSGKGRDYD